MATFKVGQQFLDRLYGDGTISRSDYNWNMGLEISKSDPVIDAATVAMIKDYYRINHDDDDEQIRRNIRTALTTIENYTNRNIIQRQVVAQWIRFPQLVSLPQAPVQSITSVETIDDEGTATALVLNTDYYSFGNEDIKLQILNANIDQLKVTYEAGYGKSLSAIPTWAQDAIIYQLGVLYSNFEEGMGTRVFDSATGLDQRAKVACDGNRYLSGS